jgi:hypothetical protein
MVAVARAPIAVAPNISMSQSGLMVAALVGGFVVFVAMQGKLANYWSIMLGGGASSATPAATTPTTTSPSTTSPTTTLPSNSSLGLPTTTSVVPGINNLPGLSNPFAAATGGVNTPAGTGVIGVPNTSFSQFFGFGSGS